MAIDVFNLLPCKALHPRSFYHSGSKVDKGGRGEEEAELSLSAGERLSVQELIRSCMGSQHHQSIIYGATETRVFYEATDIYEAESAEL